MTRARFAFNFVLRKSVREHNVSLENDRHEAVDTNQEFVVHSEFSTSV